MAATRVLAAALHSNLNLNLKQPFYFKQKALSLATKSPRRRFLFTCTALHNPSNVQTKEEGQPQTLDYRVFFMDPAGKKVLIANEVFGLISLAESLTESLIGSRHA